MTKVKHHRIQFGSGNMEKETIEVEDFPKEILKADDWFGPQVGELCFVDGKIDVVKNIYWRPAHGVFKGHLGVTFENDKSDTSYDSIIRIEVKREKVFIFKGKIFAHQEPLDGGYIEKMAHGKSITEYEYEFGQ